MKPMIQRGLTQKLVADKWWVNVEGTELTDFSDYIV